MNRWLIAAGLLLSTMPALAQGPSVPAQMPFQGRLATPSGNPVPNGSYNITLRLFNASSSGTKYWERTVSSVPVRNGTFATTLDLTGGFVGGNTLITTFNTAAPYLEIQIGADPPLTPRQQLSSAAYALKSNTVQDGAIGTNQLANGVVTNAKIAAGTIAADRLVGGLTFPPSGTAGGDLIGTYPNPSIANNAVNSSKLDYDLNSLYRVTNGKSRFYDAYGLDQANGVGSSLVGSFAWQSFTPSYSGYLGQILVYCNGNGAVRNLTMQIYQESGVGGTLLASTPVTTATGDGYVYAYLSTPVYVTSGSVYTWYLSGDSSAQYYYSPSNPYSGGTADFGAGGFDYVFYTYMEPERYYQHYNRGSFSIESNQLGNYALTAYNFNGSGAYISGYGTGNIGLIVNGASGARAANLYGDVYIGGTLSKSAGSFIIDHPLDPENKTLSHSFVESPDMMNIYNGNIKTDKRGYATVKLPEWFAALNKDYRYQLTPVGSFAQAMIAQKIANNRFVIRTDKPHIEISWQVTGVRDDAYAKRNRIPTETLKTPDKRGTYLYPEGFAKNKPSVASKK